MFPFVPPPIVAPHVVRVEHAAPTAEMRFIPSQDTTDEKAAKLCAHYGDCYMCKHHLEGCSLCTKTGQTVRYPIRGCIGRESAR